MKFILYPTLILLTVYPWGARFIPEVFGYPVVQWSALILLAVLVPMGFGVSLVEYFEQKNKKIKHLVNPIFFLLIFCSQLLIPIFAVQSSQKTLLVLTTGNDFAIKSLEILSSDAHPRSRKISAQIIYEEYGKKVPYKSENGEYFIYEPSDEDRKKYNKKSEFRKEQEAIIKNLMKQGKIHMFSAVIQILCFLVVVPIAIILREKFKPTSRSSGLAEARR